ncbi:uncharacterized protein LOC101889671 [Musca domestica]|uniref:Uncharacterized protein LOC101889671 isoform X2 n=1 Tax=Musca domestica TaxID=7370 RepID=A0A1I8M7F9_MUSDO|nr:uncharacterized protein LOC101889671 [Musca domestica]
MALQGLERHGVFVALVTLLISFMILMNEISMIKYIYVFHDDEGLSIQFILQHCGIFAMGLLTALSATLLIWGIVKKYSKLIVPWLTLAILSAVVFACCNIYDIIYRNHQWDDIMFVVVMIGIPIIIIHPMYVMYAEIRKETIEAAEYDGEYQSNENNNFGDYFVRTIY